jgi:hypothetical protein
MNRHDKWVRRESLSDQRERRIEERDKPLHAPDLERSALRGGAFPPQIHRSGQRAHPITVKH